jgi:exodeoxyribonuclease-3
LNVVSHTAIECDLLGRLQDSNNWVDIGRKFFPAPQRLYTWWSYRARDWAESDRGRRLDHMWMTQDVADKAIGHRVVEPARSWTKPSDHIPIVTEFAF